jgi:hypothetical protein
MKERDAFAAAICTPKMEFPAEMELRRLGVRCYLPVYKQKWLPRGATRPMLRAMPLFKTYILMEAADARRREMHHAQHLRQPRHLLASAEGTLWLVPGAVVRELARRQNCGEFDEV